MNDTTILPNRFPAIILGLILIIALAAPAAARSLIVYPQIGQSLAQQSQDEAECRAFAQRQSPSNPSARKKIFGGGVLGTAIGMGVVAATSGSLATGAAIGALTGGTVGAIASSREPTPQQRAFVACMRGRNYVVN